MDTNCASQNMKLHITPLQAQVDQEVTLQLSHLAPHQEATISATTRDEAGVIWKANATFRADRHGNVNLATQAPLAGTYSQIDPMGLFWSMHPLVEERKQAFFSQTTLQPLAIYFNVATKNYSHIDLLYRRSFLSANSSVREVKEQGIIATYCQPSTPGSYPGVILLSGSSGVSRIQEAALLANHGYCALALSYFGVPPLPQTLQEVPLEYIQTAIQWLQVAPQVNSKQIAIIGISKGAELALLAGATFPEIQAIIGYAPSAAVHQGLGATEADRSERSSWTYRAKPVPFLPYRPTATFQDYVNHQQQIQAPIAFRDLYLESLQHRDDLEQALIAVEKIRAPVLLLSGEDDQMWPSTVFGEMINERLNTHRHPYPHRHIMYTHAGHKTGYPYMPTTINQARGYAYGGTPEGNAHATKNAWQTTLDFLQHTFGSHTIGA
ncbi:acyl-CoA thioesterase [Dictyobacter vulcani]|uniref:Acyl-CoA thioesterase n=1 Tax=Dictyobacter vulcani TaxID=2607529 RepID=A0A5J4KIQ2_9CHLR|nr:acyl-CoA thioesterase/bile acid-CoA:amino acid N-acyltransferase family protein [Dictyobacter vulcani]GER89628.1 acyl-CoA thioesterase [Dictyobacter vulcani]